jgi:hypothetical protein
VGEREEHPVTADAVESAERVGEELGCSVVVELADERRVAPSRSTGKQSNSRAFNSTMRWTSSSGTSARTSAARALLFGQFESECG